MVLPVTLALYLRIFERFLSDADSSVDVVLQRSTIDALSPFHRNALADIDGHAAVSLSATDADVPYGL